MGCDLEDQLMGSTLTSLEWGREVPNGGDWAAHGGRLGVAGLGLWWGGLDWFGLDGKV